MADLSGQVAIVTGASSGIGLAVAEALLGRGMTVVQVSRSITPASALPGATAIAADVTDRAAIHAAVATVIGDNGRVDLLVNCAGVMYFTLMKNAKYEQWERTIDVNCKGTVNATGAVLPHMLAAKRGHVVNISSDAARTLFGALTVYNAAKAFVHVFSKGLRAECVGTGLRVTDIQPGDTATNLIVKNDDAEAAAKMGARSLRVPLASFFFFYETPPPVHHRSPSGPSSAAARSAPPALPRRTSPTPSSTRSPRPRTSASTRSSSSPGTRCSATPPP